MRQYYIYELRNTDNEVEYVGMSYRPEYRFRQHTNHKPSAGIGKFYGRKDLSLHIITSFLDKQQARLCEGLLKMYRGMEWTENEGLMYDVIRYLERIETNETN